MENSNCVVLIKVSSEIIRVVTGLS